MSLGHVLIKPAATSIIEGLVGGACTIKPVLEALRAGRRVVPVDSILGWNILDVHSSWFLLQSFQLEMEHSVDGQGEEIRLSVLWLQGLE